MGTDKSTSNLTNTDLVQCCLHYWFSPSIQSWCCLIKQKNLRTVNSIKIRKYHNDSMSERQNLWSIYQKESNTHKDVGWYRLFDSSMFEIFYFLVPKRKKNLPKTPRTYQKLPFLSLCTCIDFPWNTLKMYKIFSYTVIQAQERSS